MSGLDESITQLTQGGGLAAVLAVAFLLGLRHASDPDHLAAVSTLIATEPDGGTGRAGRLGLAWGCGHAVTLVLFGLPTLLFRAYLPEPLQRAAEMLVGVAIAVLAIRLLLRWHRGDYTARPHRHGEIEHRHLHKHAAHDHAPATALGRSPAQAFGIGLVHGIGGSAGVAVLLIAGIGPQPVPVAALAVLALGTALSMAALSSAFGYAIARGPLLRRMRTLAPGLGILSLVFGAWYALGAAGAVPYLL